MSVSKIVMAFGVELMCQHFYAKIHVSFVMLLIVIIWIVNAIVLLLAVPTLNPVTMMLMQ
jgi:hypothetical protein